MPAAGEPAAGASPRRLPFGPFVVDLRRGELTRDGHAVPLRHNAFELLLALASRPETARAIVAAHLQRHPGARAADVGRLMRSGQPAFAAGRTRLIELMRELGMP